MGIGRQYLFGYFADFANGQTNFGQLQACPNFTSENRIRNCEHPLNDRSIPKRNPAVSCGAPTIKPPLEGWILTEKFGNYRAVAHDHDWATRGSVIFLGVIDAQRMHEACSDIIRRDGAILGPFALGI